MEKLKTKLEARLQDSDSCSRDLILYVMRELSNVRCHTYHRRGNANGELGVQWTHFFNIFQRLESRALVADMETRTWHFGIACHLLLSMVWCCYSKIDSRGPRLHVEPLRYLCSFDAIENEHASLWVGLLFITINIVARQLYMLLRGSIAHLTLAVMTECLLAHWYQHSTSISWGVKSFVEAGESECSLSRHYVLSSRKVENVVKIIYHPHIETRKSIHHGDQVRPQVARRSSQREMIVIEKPVVVFRPTNGIDVCMLKQQSKYPGKSRVLARNRQLDHKNQRHTFERSSWGPWCMASLHTTWLRQGGNQSPKIERQLWEDYLKQCDYRPRWVVVLLHTSCWCLFSDFHDTLHLLQSRQELMETRYWSQCHSWWSYRSQALVSTVSAVAEVLERHSRWEGTNRW